MTGKDLLIAVGNISQKYYDEAENDTIVEASTHRSLRRPLLIAAVIALAAVLVGCAVVYALRLQDMSIGQETYTQSFDDSGKAIEPVEKTRDVLTIFGHSGDAIQKATAEWFAFLETYDPERKLTDNNPDHEEIPNQYEYTYGCYTLDMAAKVDEIAAKYNLKLLEEWLPFQTWQSDIFFEETGIDSFVLPDSGAEMTRLSGIFYPPHNFDVDIELMIPELDVNPWVTVLYARKDYFPRDIPGGADLTLYEQWDHTAADGTPLLLCLNNKGNGLVIAEKENAMIILRVDGNFSGSDYPEADQIITKEQMEALADVFDYSIQPQILNRDAVWAKLEESNKAHEEENVYVPETYGSFVDALKATYRIPSELSQYTFYDLTGDGVDELLLSGNGNGEITHWYSIQDGEIQEDFGIGFYLCEGRVLEIYSPAPELDGGVCQYFHAFSDTEWTCNNPDQRYGDWITTLRLADGEWFQAKDYHGLAEIPLSDTEAAAIREKYPRLTLDWKPTMDYPISENQTLRDYIEAQDIRLPHEELMERYKQYYTERLGIECSHYRILDINGDGVEELLLKTVNDSLRGSTDYYSMAFTYRYGIIRSIAGSFYLCEDGVLECVDTRHVGGVGVEKDGHQFIRINGLEQEVLDFVVYNKSTASWQTDWWDKEPITEEEAHAILAKYPRIDQGMRPISELLD